MKALKRTGIVLLVLVLVGFTFISWSLSDLILFPESSLANTKRVIAENWGTTYDEILSNLPTPQPFTIETFDGLTLKGNYFEKSDSSSCLIIFAHGWGETWAGMLKYVPAFENCQCDYALYDHRVHGESDGKYATGSVNESKDLLTVTDWMVTNKGFKYNQIAWIGSSWGAASALMAGATDNDVAFIVADAPFQDWNSAVFERAVKDYGPMVKFIAGSVMSTAGFRAGVNPDDASPITHANLIQEPVLLIHSSTDNETAAQQSVNIAEKLNAESEFHMTEWGNDHVMDVVNNEEDFRELVTTFIAKKSPSFLTDEFQNR